MRTNSALVVVVLAAGSLTACAADTASGDAPDFADPTAAPQGNGNGASGPEHVAGEVLIKWKPGVSASGKARARGKVGGAFDEDVTADLELAKLPPGLAAHAAAQALAGDPDVAFAEPNFVYHPSVVPDDPYLTSTVTPLWGMKGGAAGARADEAWAAAGGIDCSGVYVGIIDEGVMTTHPDLAANMAVGLHMDFTVNPPVSYTSVNDTHGTHVAGTIGGVGSNGAGVVGVCGSGIQMISAKFLGRRGGTTANAVKAVRYLTALKTEQHLNIVATNNSWGGGGASDSLLEAIQLAGDAGILFIAAAGNSGANNDTTPTYPANYASANVLSVAAIDVDAKLASWSNYGATQVELAAPGVAIWSTAPLTSKGKTSAGYQSLSGTSMATPHVTGAVALYAARHPDANADAIQAAIVNSITETTSVVGKTSTGGRLNVSAF